MDLQLTCLKMFTDRGAAGVRPSCGVGVAPSDSVLVAAVGVDEMRIPTSGRGYAEEVIDLPGPRQGLLLAFYVLVRLALAW